MPFFMALQSIDSIDLTSILHDPIDFKIWQVAQDCPILIADDFHSIFFCRFCYVADATWRSEHEMPQYTTAKLIVPNAQCPKK